MDNVEISNEQLGVLDPENMELYKVIAASIDYLKKVNSEVGEDYMSIAVAEGTIPETRKPIKKFVLASYKDLLKKNYSIVKMNHPLYRAIYSNIDYDLAQPLINYFEDEKQCLYTLRKLIDSDANIPVISFSGVLTSTIIHIHNVNVDKINSVIEMSQNSKNNAFNVILPDSYTTPYNQEFINEMESTISKFLVKSK